MFVATGEVDILLGDVHSLKEKRALVRPIVREVRREFEVAAAETGFPDLHRRAIVTVAAVSGSAAHAREVVDACEAWFVDRPGIEILGVRRRLFGGDDEGIE